MAIPLELWSHLVIFLAPHNNGRAAAKQIKLGYLDSPLTSHPPSILFSFFSPFFFSRYFTMISSSKPRILTVIYEDAALVHTDEVEKNTMTYIEDLNDVETSRENTRRALLSSMPFWLAVTRTARMVCRSQNSEGAEH